MSKFILQVSTTKPRKFRVLVLDNIVDLALYSVWGSINVYDTAEECVAMLHAYLRMEETGQ